MSEKTSLGDRMKGYESAAESRLLPGTPIIARIDGRAFHTFTRNMRRPYDVTMSSAMVNTTKKLVEESNALLGYTQSDEISLLFFAPDSKSETFFNGRRDKLVSVLASMASVYFREQQLWFKPEGFNQDLAFFDCRVFNTPTRAEAFNYFLWRERDATKNSISMAAQSVYSHAQLHEKNSSEKQELLFQKGINWNNYPEFFKRGTYVKRLKKLTKFTSSEIEKLPAKHAARSNPNLEIARSVVTVMSVPPIHEVEDKIGFLFGDSQ
jgi:tRNA(His) 5'-end guanylyltransferase